MRKTTKNYKDCFPADGNCFPVDGYYEENYKNHKDCFPEDGKSDDESTTTMMTSRKMEEELNRDWKRWRTEFMNRKKNEITCDLTKRIIEIIILNAVSIPDMKVTSTLT